MYKSNDHFNVDSAPVTLEKKCTGCTNSLTSRSQTQSSRLRWVERRSQRQTCSPVGTTWRRWQLGWSWGWPAWASILLPSGTTHRRCGPLHTSRYGHSWEPSQFLQDNTQRREMLRLTDCCHEVKGTSRSWISFYSKRSIQSENVSRWQICSIAFGLLMEIPVMCPLCSFNSWVLTHWLPLFL